jgi:hypothetical protein
VLLAYLSFFLFVHFSLDPEIKPKQRLGRLPPVFYALQVVAASMVVGGKLNTGSEIQSEASSSFNGTVSTNA